MSGGSDAVQSATAGPSAAPAPHPVRIVVTGMGAVSGWGDGKAALWQGLMSGTTTIGPFRRFDASRHRTKIAAEVPGELGDGAPVNGHAGRLSLADRYALRAASEALAQAGLEVPSATAEAGVFFGSSTGGMWESERYYARLLRYDPGRPRLAELSSQQYNGPGDALARWVQASGPVESVSSACTSATLAVALGCDALRAGEVELAIVGGSDSLCQLTYAGFNSLRAVAPEACRPFRAERSGMSLGEGSGVLVLETLEHALARGAQPLAELLGAVSACDAHHMTAPSPEGKGAAASILRALEESGLGPDAVDFVNAHGTGTPLNDAAEWQALQAAFGERAATLPVAAPKGSVGHLLGAAGAVEAIATVMCLQEGCVHPAPIAGEVDPQAPAHLVLGEPLRAPVDVGVSINLAFGGSNAALVFRRWPAAGEAG